MVDAAWFRPAACGALDGAVLVELRSRLERNLYPSYLSNRKCDSYRIGMNDSCLLFFNQLRALNKYGSPCLVVLYGLMSQLNCLPRKMNVHLFFCSRRCRPTGEVLQLHHTLVSTYLLACCWEQVSILLKRAKNDTFRGCFVSSNYSVLVQGILFVLSQMADVAPFWFQQL